MSLISVKGYENAGVHSLMIKKKTDKLWVNMKHVEDGLGIKNMSDLAKRNKRHLWKKKQLTKEEIKNYKMTVREIYKKFANLGEDK